ncbi:hypothetical protein ACFQ0B_70330 [Nonomuraea thailandensis]
MTQRSTRNTGNLAASGRSDAHSGAGSGSASSSTHRSCRRRVLRYVESVRWWAPTWRRSDDSSPSARHQPSAW